MKPRTEEELYKDPNYDFLAGIGVVIGMVGFIMFFLGSIQAAFYHRFEYIVFVGVGSAIMVVGFTPMMSKIHYNMKHGA